LDVVERDTTEQVALVTGAGSGLGAATVSAFIEAGYRVAALDLQVDDTVHDDDVVDRFRCDVSDSQAVSETISCVLDRFARIDVVVNCAGIDHTYWLEDLTVEQFDQIIGVNLRGPFLVAKAVWPVMKQQHGGHIVNIASTAAVRVWPGASAYHASKFGVLGLSRALSLEGRSEGIKVTTIIPGGMRTAFFERFTQQGIPLPDPEQLQDPMDVARTIVFTVSMPSTSLIQELIVTPPNEPSWP
jgi:NAD(P)-dependent dehydrogenase (short-subunit alcohol dehydrogenase family)